MIVCLSYGRNLTRREIINGVNSDYIADEWVAALHAAGILP